MNKKERKLKVLSVIIGIIFALCIVEVSMRLFIYPPPEIYEPNLYLGWFHKPNSHKCYNTEEFSVCVKINSKGLRDYEYEYEKRNNIPRILILGDSFAEGMQVELDKTFAKILEKELNEHSNQTFEVINAGVGGYGTGNELFFYHYEGKKYSPDIVILQFFIGNDISDNFLVIQK